MGLKFKISYSHAMSDAEQSPLVMLVQSTRGKVLVWTLYVNGVPAADYGSLDLEQASRDAGVVGGKWLEVANGDYSWFEEAL